MNLLQIIKQIVLVILQWRHHRKKSVPQAPPNVEAPGTIPSPSEVEPVIEAPVVVDPEPPKPVHIPVFCWCLDPGHGSLQPGKRSPVTDDGRQLLEYEFNRDILSRITKQLDEIGVEYFVVVPEVHIGSALKERVRRTNNHQTKKPKVFVSIHANAGPTGPGKWTVANGIETWFKHGDEASQAVAAIFQKHLVQKTGLRDRFLKSRSKNEFYVLKHTSCAAILTENGFYNNWKEVQKLFTDEYRQQVADAHVAAILECERIVIEEKILS